MDYMDGYEFGRPYMVGDEYILWKGKPEKGALFTGREIIMLPFALIWLAFSVFWELTAIFSGAPLFLCINYIFSFTNWSLCTKLVITAGISRMPFTGGGFRSERHFEIYLYHGGKRS